jgi:hypothetical protein
MRDKYYKQYLKNHSRPKVKLMHFIGQVLTLAYVSFCVATRNWFWLLLSPLVIYPFAVSGHYLFGAKGNKPSFHKMPFLTAKWCDVRMFVDILRGKYRLW